MNKTCKKCLVEKEVTEFHLAGKGKYGRSARCKLCVKEEASKPRQIELAKKRHEKYYTKNKEKQSKKCKERYLSNKQEVINRSKLWKQNNPERADKTKKNYIENNKDKIKEYFRDYQKKLRVNPHYKLKKNMSYAIWRGLKESKFGKHWEDLIPYTSEELIAHLESRFEEGMSWENYGKGGWHIDHIIPQSYFKFDSYDHPAFKACWDLNNLQPMWGKDNLSKGNKIEITQEIKEVLDKVNSRAF